MILSGETIQELNNTSPIIEPFYLRTVHNGMSFGVSVAGYDIRAEFDDGGRAAAIVLHPGEFRLVSAIEKVRVPEDCMVILHDKSTWARRGLAVQNTVFEPGWVGHPTIELTNHGPLPIKIERGDPIAQMVFHKLDRTVDGYDGKYQNQGRGPVNAKRENS